MFSLRAIIDDILLIVRNNNISESEDLSRSQIAAWVMHYKSALHKEQKDKDDPNESLTEEFDDSAAKVVGPLELKVIESLDMHPLFAKITINEIPDLLNDDPNNIIAVYDQQDCVLQRMHGLRRHFHYFRKYTGMELTYDYEKKHIIVNGECDHHPRIKYIWVKYLASGEDEDANEEDINIPGWMIPEIKRRIFANELSFMIKMPSDDDNNSTLDGIKPHGPQDQEK